jgi:hypothetical protein
MMTSLAVWATSALAAVVPTSAARRKRFMRVK